MSAFDDALWVGLDLGTQSAKATVVDGHGRTRARGDTPLRGTRHGDVHEQDPVSWVAAAETVLGRVLAGMDAAERGRVRGIAVSATSGSITVLDERGSVRAPGLMYDDTRAAAFAPRLREVLHERSARNGAVVQDGWAICRILWLADNGMLPEGTRIVHQGDVVAEALVGRPVSTDWTSALKSGWDAVAGDWAIEAFAGVAGLPQVPTDRLPDVVAPGTLLGHSSTSAEARCGLPAGTPVFAGMTDGCAAQVGAGALAEGDWHTVLGTTLVVKGVASRPISAGDGAVYSHRAPDDGLWLPGGASNTGAGALTVFAHDADLVVADHELAVRTDRIAPSYPLTRTGERFPFRAPDARGFVLMPDPQPLDALAGMPAVDAVASIWAGVACVERLCFDVLAARGATLTGRLSSSGGGTRSVTWTRMRASLLQRPIVLPDRADSAMGVAVLACWGARRAAGNTASLAQTSAAMSPAAVIVEPDDLLATQLEPAYDRFRETLASRGWI